MYAFKEEKGKSECNSDDIFSFPVRKPTDDMNYDGETLLQGLVSNILDEANSRHSYTERYVKVYGFHFFGLGL